MKRLSYVAMALAVLASPAQAYEAPQEVKDAAVAQVVSQTAGMTLSRFCAEKAYHALGAEGTAPDSIERAIDYGMTSAYYVHSKGWTDEQRDECARIEIQEFQRLNQEREDEQEVGQ